MKTQVSSRLKALLLPDFDWVCQHVPVRKLCLPIVALSLVLALQGCGGTASNAAGVLTGTPAIVAVTPNPVTRGNSITITGTNFNGTNTTAWFTGNLTASSTASSGGTTTVSVVVPTSIPAGTYNMYVITTDGQGDYSSNSNAVTLTLN